MVKYWLGYKHGGKNPDTYHKVTGKTKNDAIGKFLKGSRYTYGDVVVRRSPPKRGWTVGKHFASKKRRKRRG